MEFRILGPLEMLDAGRPVKLGARKQRVLLAALLLEANRVVSIDRLVEAVWDDEPPTTAPKALHVYVSQLRKLLGRERLVTRAPGYLLRVEEGEFDLRRFERLLGEGEHAEALALWRGPPLAEFQGSRFAEGERARLEELRQVCLEERIEKDLAAGRHIDLVGELEGLIREQPLRQRLRRQLMLALYRSGRDAEALDVYQETRRELVGELGIEPRRELRDLQQAILRQDPSLDLMAGEAPGESSSVFIGRQREHEQLSVAAGLLEREEALATLEQSLAAARCGCGRLVFVSGEAGVGKTALVRAFCARSSGARVLWGACESLFTPRPLGPLLDVAESVGGELAAVVQSGARPYEVAAALLRELRTATQTILVLEDVHDADEATLDILRLIARRIATAPALVLVSHRDDELESTHPLRIVLGELATGESSARVALARLSPDGVAELARPLHVDVAELYRRTSGNPFFVIEALAGGAGTIPRTVTDAVLARAARLSFKARALLEVVAVVPVQAEIWLLEALAGGLVDELEACLSSGMLVSLPDAVAFRHELARLAVEESLPPNRKRELHRRALRALAGSADPARLTHHAEAAGDATAVLEFALAAGARAVSLGAHREAAAQYARALRFADGAGLDTRGDLLDRRAYACYLVGEFDEATDSQRRAVDCYRQLGDRRREGDALRSLSRLLRYLGRTDEAMRVGREAVAVLEPLERGHELAMAYCNVSHLYMSLEDAENTLAWGTRGLELAEQLDDGEARVYARTNIATTDLLKGRDATDELVRILELARQADLDEHAGRAYVALSWWSPRGRNYAAVDRYLERALEYCNERGLDLWRLYALAVLARSQLDRGQWDDAVDSAALVLSDPRATPIPRITALAIVGLIRARRGEPEVWAPLDEAWELARPTGELQRLEPAAAARAEAAWLDGRPKLVAEATQATLELAMQRRAGWIVGELACLRRRVGVRDELSITVPEPWAAELAGDWERAAKRWSELDAPYEAALALTNTNESEPLERALAELQGFAAKPASAIAAQRLREPGVHELRARRIPRHGATTQD